MVKKYTVFDVINIILLLFLAIITIYPFIYVFAVALNDPIDTVKGGIWLYPRVFTFANFIEAFKDDIIYNSIIISVSRTVITTVLALILNLMLAYSMMDKQLKGRKFLLKFMFIPTLFSGGIIPWFLLVRALRLVNSFLIYVIPALYGFYTMVILRTAFEGVPDSLAEAAKIDGANDFTILFGIYIPLTRAAIATIVLFTGVAQWNDWFAGMFYVTNEHLKPAATILRQLVIEASSSNISSSMGGGVIKSTQSLQMAVLVITVMPILCVYPFVQKHFVQGVMIGGVKG